MKLDFGDTKTDRVLAEAFGTDVYVIGGPVRDKLRELFHGVPFEPKDKDYVVVGTPVNDVQETLNRFGRVDAVGATLASSNSPSKASPPWTSPCRGESDPPVGATSISRSIAVRTSPSRKTRAGAIS